MWSKCCCKRKGQNLNTQEEDLNPFRQRQSPEEEKEPGAYLTIFMYYVQIPALLQISILYDDGREEPLQEFQTNIASIFTFDSFGFSFNTCLFEDVTPVIKVALRSAFVAYLFAILVLLLLIGLLMRLCGYGRGEESRSSRGSPRSGPEESERQGCWPTSIPVGARFIGAFIALILYTYEYISENGFNLLRCVHISSINQNVMFIDGTEECYQEWQYVVIVFVLVYVVPMFAVVSIAPVLLRERRIKVAVFVFSLIFPLILLPFLIVLFVRHRKEMINHSIVENKSHKRNGAVDTVVHLIAEPYKLNKMGGFCWEGIIILRRLIIVAIATLINSVITRHILLVIACLLSMITHNRIKPFTKKSCNILESVSLSILLVISFMNLVKGVYFDSGEVPLGVADSILHVYDYIEVILVSIIPTAILLFVALCILLRVFAWPIEACQKMRRSRSDQQNGFGQVSAIPNHMRNGDARGAYFNYYNDGQNRYNNGPNGYGAPVNGYRTPPNGYNTPPNGYAGYGGRGSDPGLSQSPYDRRFSSPEIERFRNQGYGGQAQVYSTPQYTWEQHPPPHHQNQNRRQSDFPYNTPRQRQQFDSYSDPSVTTAWPRRTSPFYGQHYRNAHDSHWGSQQPYQHNPRRPNSGEWRARRR